MTKFSRNVIIKLENNQVNYVVNYTYDVLGRLTSVSDNKNGEAAYTYDDNGNLLSKNVCGIVSEYVYDELNSVTQAKTTWEDKWIKTNLTYDLAGNVTDEVTRNSQYSLTETGSPIYEKEFTYNGLNQLVMEDFTYKPGTTGQYSDVMQYAYDYAGNRTMDDCERIATQVSDQRPYVSASYTYDNNNRLTTKTDYLDDETYTTSYTYDNNGNELSVTERDENNAVLSQKTFEYDILNRLTYYFDGQDIDTYARGSYTYYADGMRKSKNVGGINTEFVWDGGTLVGEMYDDEAYSQEFTKSTDTETLAIKVSRTESVGELSVDIYAKSVTIAQTLAGTVLLHEDACIDDEDGWATVDISSLPAGDYVFKMSGYGTGVYIHRAMSDSGAHKGTDIVEGTFSYKLISTTDVETGPAVTQTETDYVPMAQYSDALAKTYMTGLTTELSSSGSLDRTYYLTNWRGDVNIVLDNEQDIRASYTYNAFGTEREESLMTPISTSSAVYDTNPIRYAGQYYDSESGNYYLRARYYNPYTGRFTSEDPAQDGLNWYSYCAGNPVGYVDTNGLVAYELFDTPEEAAIDFAWNYAGVVDYSMVEQGALIYTIVDENGDIKYGYTYGVVGTPHNVDVYEPLYTDTFPKGAEVYATIHIHVNTTEISGADKDFLYDKNSFHYIVTPGDKEGTVDIKAYYNDAETGQINPMGTIVNGLTFNQLSEARKQEVRKNTEGIWEAHKSDPNCTFGCKHKKWPRER